MNTPLWILLYLQELRENENQRSGIIVVRPHIAEHAMKEAQKAGFEARVIEIAGQMVRIRIEK